MGYQIKQTIQVLTELDDKPQKQLMDLVASLETEPQTRKKQKYKSHPAQQLSSHKVSYSDKAEDKVIKMKDPALIPEMKVEEVKQNTLSQVE